MEIMFESYLDEVFNSKTTPPSFIRLTRQKPYQGSASEYPEDEYLLGLFPFKNEKDHFHTRYTSISKSKEKKAVQFPENCFIDNFKVETAYFVLAKKWKSLKECFNDLRPKLLYIDWLENYSDSGLRSDEGLPDFLRIVGGSHYADYMRIGGVFARIEYSPNHYGGEILPLMDEFAEKLESELPIKIYIASFGNHPEKKH